MKAAQAEKIRVILVNSLCTSFYGLNFNEWVRLLRKHRFGVDHAPPQPARRHDVGLVYRRHPPLAPLRCLEGHPRDPLHLLTRVDAQVARALLALLFLPEVRAACQFADDEDIYSSQYFLFERRSGEQRRYGGDGTQVSERPEMFAQP